MKHLIEIFKRIGLTIFMTSQKLLLGMALFFIYFLVFGWFSIPAKYLELRRLRKDRLSRDSLWLKPALGTPTAQSYFYQS